MFVGANAEDNPQDLRATVSQFLYQMRISAKLQRMVQLLEAEGLGAILRRAATQCRAGGAKANKAIVSTQLAPDRLRLGGHRGDTSKTCCCSLHRTRVRLLPVEKDDIVGVGGSVEVVEDEASGKRGGEKSARRCALTHTRSAAAAQVLGDSVPS